jgi:hypothetical protein
MLDLMKQCRFGNTMDVRVPQQWRYCDVGRHERTTYCFGIFYILGRIIMGRFEPLDLM